MFVGGGTPSLLGAGGSATVLDAVRSTFGLAPGRGGDDREQPGVDLAEFFAAWLEAGFTRVSLGMQSAAPHVLRMLERRHTPGRAVAAAREARAAGLAHVNLDLIYATPGETDDDLRASLDAVLAAGVDHVSAYALIVEDGTALARRVARGEVAAPGRRRGRGPLRADRRRADGGGLRLVRGVELGVVDGGRVPAQPGVLARRRLVGAGAGRALAPGRARAGGTSSTRPGTRRCWRRGSRRRPGAEELTEAERATERVMLRLRLASGLPLALLDDARPGGGGAGGRGRPARTRSGRLTGRGRC